MKKKIQARFPVGTCVKDARYPYEGKAGKVTGHALDWVEVRFGARDVRHCPPDKLVALPRDSISKLLRRMKKLDALYTKARDDMRDPKLWPRAHRVEQALLDEIRDIVFVIRVISPSKVPWGWKSARL